MFLYLPTPDEPRCRAARHLMNMQQPNGDWPQQTISGVFNHNCMITYANYRWVCWVLAGVPVGCERVLSNSGWQDDQQLVH